MDRMDTFLLLDSPFTEKCYKLYHATPESELPNRNGTLMTNVAEIFLSCE